MHQRVIDLLKNGATANKADKFRRGNLICLPAEGSLIAAGDIHGHRRNFQRIVTFADLDSNPNRHIILQEIIHGGPKDAEEGCLSYQLLFDAVDYKLKFPDRVHIIMGNHDTAYVCDSAVLKDGREMNVSMRAALERQYGAKSPDINAALRDFLISQPLAVRCENRLWFSHSLPADRNAEKFDKAILDRPLEICDLRRPGSAYLLTWGRNHSQSLLDKMAKLFDVDILVLGHQAQPEGWSRSGDNLVIIASDHNHGCLLSVDMVKSYTTDELIETIVTLASIA
jgi:predicted phosphodiesterase